MTIKEIFFVCILLLNAVIAVLYLLFGLIYAKRCRTEEDGETEEQKEPSTEDGQEEDIPKIGKASCRERV